MKRLLLVVFIISSAVWAKTGPVHPLESASVIQGKSKQLFQEHFYAARAPGYFYYEELVKEMLPRFAGKPYGSASVSCPSNKTLVNLETYDCVTFVEHFWALMRTTYDAANGNLPKGSDPFIAFINNLNRIRYIGGVNCGINDRIHYFTHALLELERIGLLMNVAYLNGVRIKKTINYMSTHQEDFGDLDWNRQVKYEKLLSTTPNYFYPEGKFDLYYPLARNGDIVGLATSESGLDVSHCGIITVEDGEVKFTHASKRFGKVLLEDDLKSYLYRERTVTGVYVFRPIFE